MIFSTLHIDYKGFDYPKVIEQALAYLQAHDFTTFKPGSYDLIGRKMYANVDVVMTKPYEETKVEGHKDYIDVQCLIVGEERMEYLRNCGNYEPVEAYDDKDVYFYDPTLGGEAALTVKPLDYAIFYPGDLHRTLIAPAEGMEIRKVIVKIHRDLLGLSHDELNQLKENLI